MGTPEIAAYEPSQRAALAALLNEAYADLRALRPVGIEGPDYPEFTEAGLAAAKESGALQPEATFVLTEGETLVAAASCGSFRDDGTADLLFIGTAPSRRRQGYATALLNRCLDAARAAGAQTLRTGPFVDSRYVPACALFERCGFGLPDLDRSNVTWEIDLDAWQPRELELAPDCRIVSFRPGDEAAWCEVNNAIFSGEWTVERFRARFRDLPNFDPDGWFFAEHQGRKVGIAGAIVWFADAALTQPTGALVEWVGVRPEARGLKLGEALMLSCLRYLKGRAVYPNCLLTQYFRQPAVALYRKLGYRIVRECRTYVRDLA